MCQRKIPQSIDDPSVPRQTRPVRTEHLNEFIQERHRVVISDNQEEKPDMKDVVFPNEVFGKIAKSIELIHVDIIR